LLLGSIFSALLISVGCNTERTEWVHIGEWNYINNSTHTVEIIGGITDFTSSNPSYSDFTLQVNETHSLECRSNGESKIEAEAIPCPYEDVVQLKNRVIQVIIDKKDIVALDPKTSIRNRDNYVVLKLSPRHYRFTYTFTDEIIAEIKGL